MAAEKGPLIVGLSIPQPTPDAAPLLQSARADGYDFVTTALPHTTEPRSDVTSLAGKWWRTSVVGLVPETSNPETLVDRLEHQLQWATHMGIPAVILPTPPSDLVVEYARVISSHALQGQNANLQLWIKTFLDDQSLQDYELLHRLCDGMSNIGMVLIMEPMPTMNSAAATVASQIILLHKAVGANLKAVSLPTKIFLTNKRGYPTLAKSHQVVFTEILKRVGRTIRVLLDGPSVHDIPNAGDGVGSTKCLPYLQYIRHIRDRPECVATLDSEEANMEAAYLDSLQRPLQPLKDHLEFSMYETFEKDPIKYTKYQEAIYMALKKGVESVVATPAAPKYITVAVVGAGRGPLVMRAIRAFQQLEVNTGSFILNLFAVEKNPSAIVFLESMTLHNPDWSGVVKVVHADARGLTPERLQNKQIDIIVSELLGSFGDNELSPECLDPLLASACCKPTTISIPMRYTAYLAPISSMRLHTDARQQSQVPHDGGQPVGLQRAMETAYVVRTYAASQTHQEQACWTFQHPTGITNKERTATLEFAPDPTFAAATGCGYGPVDVAVSTIVSQAPASTAGPVTIHGFLGSFTAVLFEDGDSSCEISIAPHRFSQNMFSWFPIYFPFREPLHVPAGSNVKAKMWRKNSEGKVWYEWCATVHRKGEVIATTPIHNTNGRSSHISM